MRSEFSALNILNMSERGRGRAAASEDAAMRRLTMGTFFSVKTRALGALAAGALLGLTGCPSSMPAESDMRTTPTDMAMASNPDLYTPPKPLLPGCSKDDWCWSNPQPQGNALTSVWGASSTDAWAVGARGTMLHWDGSKWNTAVKETTSNLLSVWGSGPNNVFAVGERNTVLRWDGQKWSSIPATVVLKDGSGNDVQKLVNLNSVWGSDATHVWIVGENGVILSWDGNKLTQQANAYPITLQSVWGLSDKVVYASGYLGTLLKWNGTEWNSQLGPGAAAERDKITILSVWGTAENNLFAATDLNGGRLFRYNGTSWTLQNVTGLASSARYRVISLWGQGTDLFVVGEVGYSDSSDETKRFGMFLKWDGTNFVAQPSAPVVSLASVWGTSPTDVVAVGAGGSIVRYNGTAFNTIGMFSSISGIAGNSPSQLIGVGDWGVTMQFDGTNWSVNQGDAYQRLRGISGSGENIWAAGFAANDAGNPTRLLRWTGTSWQAATVTVKSELKGIFSSATEGYAVGNSDTILRRNGTNWTQVTVPAATGTTLRGAWAADASNAWFVGGGDDNPRNPTQPAGRILFYNGTAVSVVTPASITSADPPIFLYGVWGAAANNVWAVGDAGTILNWNGSTWQKQVSNTGRSLRAIWGSDASNVYAAGDDGTIVHWNGQQWARQDSGTANLLQAMWGQGKDVYIGGTTGSVLKKINR